jgi:hydrogenase assembly chaperone HypC/HupF
MSGHDLAGACVSDGHCVTCSDEGVPMRVLASEGDGLATCGAEDGLRSEVMTDLVGPVGPGDAILVHAGVAIARLDGKAAAA